MNTKPFILTTLLALPLASMSGACTKIKKSAKPRASSIEQIVAHLNAVEKAPANPPPWPSLTGEEEKKLEQVNKLTGTSAVAAAAEMMRPWMKRCPVLSKAVLGLSGLRGDARRKAVFDTLKDKEDAAQIEACDLPIEKKIIVFRLLVFHLKYWAP